MRLAIGIVVLALGLAAGEAAWRWVRCLLGDGVELSDLHWPRFACAAIYACVWGRCGVSPMAVELWLLCPVLVAIALVDRTALVIPDELTACAALIRMGYIACAGALGAPDAPALALRSAIGMAATLAVMLVLTLVMDRILGTESMGGGDLKLLAVCGLYVGWRPMPFLLLLACLGGVAGSLLAAQGQVRAMRPFAFGPAICAALLATIVLEGRVEAWMATWVF